MGDSNGDEMVLPPIMNSVLCYTSTARHSMRNDDIVRVCLAFYKEEQILKAKDLIFNLVGEKPIRRRNENRKTNELQDVMAILKRCDEKRMDLPKFVADSYDSLPPSSGFDVVAESLISLIDEISLLRKEVEFLKEKRVTDLAANRDMTMLKEDVITVKGELRKLNHKLIGENIRRNSILLNTIDQNEIPLCDDQEGAWGTERKEMTLSPISPMINSNNPENRAYGSLCESQPPISTVAQICTPSFSPSAPPASQIHEQPWMHILMNDDGGPATAPSFADVCRENSEIIHNSPAGKSRKNTDRMSRVDNEGFQMVEGKRKRQNNIVGAKNMKSVGLIKGAVRSADLYIGNCDLDVSEESLTKYIEEEVGVNAINCSILVSKNVRCKSFKVELSIKDRQKVLVPEIWPEGIIVRKFYNPRNKSSS